MGIASLHQIASERGTILRKVHDGELLTVKTGFGVLDTRTQGFRGGDFIVIGVRPDYYNMDKDDFVPTNITELIVPKNAHGGIGTVEICFQPDKLKFMPLKEDSEHGV